jgi:membrane protease YdiL (CAAX protease family)
MPGLIVELILSWLLLWLFFKKGLLVLGIVPTKGRLYHLFFVIFIAAVCAALYYLSFVLFTTNQWTINTAFTAQQLVASSWWTLNSVLYEEFIFRGALLYILIQKTGVRTACLLSAICFGVYHWFTSGAWGDPVQMMIIFLMTGTWGVMFAMAFARTKSLYLPIGLHFGWNFVSTVIFSQGPLGKQLLIINGGQNLGDFVSVVVLVFQLLAVPVFTYWYLNWLSKKQKTVIETAITTEHIGIAQSRDVHSYSEETPDR